MTDLPAPDDAARRRWDEGAEDELSVRLRSVLLLAARTRPALARRFGVSPTEMSAIEHLTIESMGPVELSRRLDLTSAASTILARRLEASGHVRRGPHPGDRRRTVLRPTDSTLHEMGKHLSPFIAEVRAAGADLDDDQRDAVVAYLRRIEAALEGVVTGDVDLPGHVEPAAPSASGHDAAGQGRHLGAGGPAPLRGEGADSSGRSPR